MLHDSGRNQPRRILIFSTERNLNMLCNSPTIFTDGTFKTTPNQFAQLFTVHAIFMNFVFPVVFCLTQQKDEETYREIYRQLRLLAEDFQLTLNPQISMSDFELANLNALRGSFDGISIRGCLFHFTQNIFKNAVNRGLRIPFFDLEDPNIRNQVRYLMALPFIPLEDLMETYDMLEADFEDERVLDLAEYFEVTYLRGRPARGRRRATPPRYPPPTWNVYQSVLNRQARTNNKVESFHSRFQRIVVAHHLNIWRFIGELQKEQQDTEAAVTQLLGGHGHLRDPINSTYVRNQRRVETIVGNYEEYKQQNNVRTYLRAIANNLKQRADETRTDSEGGDD